MLLTWHCLPKQNKPVKLTEFAVLFVPQSSCKTMNWSAAVLLELRDSAVSFFFFCTPCEVLHGEKPNFSYASSVVCCDQRKGFRTSTNGNVEVSFQLSSKWLHSSRQMDTGLRFFGFPINDTKLEYRMSLTLL